MPLARVKVVKIQVDSSPLFRGKGMVRRWMGGVQREMTGYTKRAAPARSGAMRGGVRGSVATVGRRRVQGSTWSYAPYTDAVVYGTKGPIRTRRGQAEGVGEGKSWVYVRGKYGRMRQSVSGFWMRLPPYGGYPTLYRDEVAGQKANNFFHRAYMLTRARHRALPFRYPARRL